MHRAQGPPLGDGGAHEAGADLPHPFEGHHRVVQPLRIVGLQLLGERRQRGERAGHPHPARGQAQRQAGHPGEHPGDPRLRLPDLDARRRISMQVPLRHPHAAHVRTPGAQQLHLAVDQVTHHDLRRPTAEIGHHIGALLGVEVDHAACEGQLGLRLAADHLGHRAREMLSQHLGGHVKEFGLVSGVAGRRRGDHPHGLHAVLVHGRGVVGQRGPAASNRAVGQPARRVDALTQADDAHLAGDVSQAGLAGHALCHQQSDGVGAAVHGPHADGAGAARLGMWGILLVGAHASVPPSSGIPSSSGVGQSCGIAVPRSPVSAASATDSSPRRTTPGPSASA